jgi:hypothetical protein
VENNVIGDSMVLVFTRKWTPDYDPYHIGYASTHTRQDSTVVRELTQRGNILGNPMIENPAAGDFRVSGASPAWNAGFQPIPYDKIGLQVDNHRRSLPK